MGIAHLTSHLRPYGTVKDLEGQDIVIDGPGLTYHIYYICCALQSHARNPFEAIPSYQIVGETVVKWLDDLKRHGVDIKKIYFDGLLPPSKREVRISRLMNYTRQLSHYHESWPQIIPRSSNELGPPAHLDLFNGNPGSSIASQLPAAPFIVPAVIEVLSASETYGSITEVVPNEADTYCAAYVRLHSGVVLTSDSDLLIHDLGNGAVSFFKDIERSNPENCLRSLQYAPTAIASRLDLPKSSGIKALAFELLINPNLSLPQLLKRAAKSTSISSNQALYQDFALQYDAPRDDKANTSSSDITSRSVIASSVLRSLDPRISEYVLQCDSMNECDTKSHPGSQKTSSDRCIDVYLPFLLDCPSKTSAWEISISVRQLAYGLINVLLSPTSRISSVIEHRRQQSRTQGREWQLPTIDDLPDACEEITEIIKKYHNPVGETSGLAAWNGIAIYQDLHQAMSDGKKPLSEALILHYSSAENKRISWDTIQFSAQLQGSYYSFRILKQILDVVIASMKSDMVPVYLRRVQQVLKTLPKLSALPSFSVEVREIGNEEIVSYLKTTYTLLGINNSNPPTSSSKKSSKKRKKKGPPSVQTSDATADLPTNLYDILKLDQN